MHIFKIINQVVPEALENLGYNEEQIEDIVSYAVDMEHSLVLMDFSRRLN